MSAEGPLTVVQSIAEVMREVSHVAKEDRNSHQGFLFRGVDATVNAVGPALRTHGVVVVPNVRKVDWELVRTANDKPATACRVVVEYRFIGPMGDDIVASVVGEAWDSGDKSAPKAMSVAFRTALLQALCLPTHDRTDPDHDTYVQGEPDEVYVSEADVLKEQIRNVAKEKELPLECVAQDFEARTKLALRGCTDTNLLRHFLGHLRTQGLVIPKGAKTP